MHDEGYTCQFCNEGVLPGLRCGCPGESAFIERERIIAALVKRWDALSEEQIREAVEPKR